jgi:malate dehydrogenase (oxaloacetate-decarboxylating)
MTAAAVPPFSDPSFSDPSFSDPSRRDADPAFALHRGGKIEVASSVPLRDRDDLSLAYTPGVARVCEAIAEDATLAYDYTWKARTVAVVTDGTAVLGLGDIGPEAALPVMEGKAMLFKHFGGVDAVPICLACTGVDEIVETVVRLAPAFGGINLEDISRRAASRSSGGSTTSSTSRCSTTTSTAPRSSCWRRCATRPG